MLMLMEFKMLVSLVFLVFRSGHTNISYMFMMVLTDLDKNLLVYVFDWGDGSQSKSPLFMSDHLIYTMNQWSLPGFYTVQVFKILAM